MQNNEIAPLPKTKSAHGGARENAGRKPKALKYASELAIAEEKIMSALPAAIESLVASAACGDTSAAKYLLDRAFGRIKEQTAAIAEDMEVPPTEEDFERLKRKKEFSDRLDVW